MIEDKRVLVQSNVSNYSFCVVKAATKSFHNKYQMTLMDLILTDSVETG